MSAFCRGFVRAWFVGAVVGLVAALLASGCAVVYNAAPGGHASLTGPDYLTADTMHVHQQNKAAEDVDVTGVQGAKINSVASGNSVVPAKVKIGASK